MEEARLALREQKANVIYGAVRLIEKDEESYLRWARESDACVIFNLHVTHDSAGLEAAARAFRALDAREAYSRTARLCMVDSADHWSRPGCET